MSDLLERLRKPVPQETREGFYTKTTYEADPLRSEAADEIERLLSELADARRQAFIEAAEIAENMTLAFEGNEECLEVNRNIRKVAKEIRHRAEEMKG